MQTIFTTIGNWALERQIRSINPHYIKDYRNSSHGSRLSYLVDSEFLHVVLVGTGSPLVRISHIISVFVCINTYFQR